MGTTEESNADRPVTDRQKIEELILALVVQRSLLGGDAVDVMIATLRRELERVDSPGLPQRKQVTVLFADLVGFTALTEKMDAEYLAELLNLLWERLDRVILRYKGTIDKHVGDGLMALFGAPTAREDDPERAVLAGLVMQAELRKWVNDQLESEVNPAFARLAMRIGINTGPVLFGAMGSTREYTVMGDTVNIASRLEGVAPVGGLLVSEATWRQVAGRFKGRCQTVLVKGKAEPLRAWEILGEKSVSQRTSGRGVAGVETRTVGREVELGQLCLLFGEVAEEGKARVVTVLGEAGIGKTRLLQEFSAWLAEQPRASRVLSAKASAETEGHPYFLVRECIASELQITNSTPDSLAEERMVEGFAAVSEGDPGMAEFIGHLIGLDFSGSSRIQNILGDTQQIHLQAFQYLARFIRAIGRKRPVVILLEDIHWADSGSLDVIEFLAQECEDVPLLIVCLARANLLERRAGWGNNQPTSTILRLQPLPREESGLLVQEILRHAKSIPENLISIITEAAEGNAFYIEELVKVLIDDGVIVQDETEWHIRDEGLGELRIPPTLTTVLQARMDRLPQRERELLQRASVVGRTFWEDTLVWLDGSAESGEETDLEGQGRAILLNNLVRSEFIEKSQASAFEGVTEYQFRHAILHDVVYESVLLRHRRPYHQRVAEWLIQAAQDQKPKSVGLIGEHFAQAGRSLDAAYWFGKAADQAREAYLPEVAIDYFKNAIAHYQECGGAASGVQCQSLYYHLGDMYFLQGRYDDAIDALGMADQLGEQNGKDFERSSQVWSLLSKVQGRKGAFVEAVESAEKAIQLAHKAGSDKELVQAFVVKIGALINIGSLEEAEALCREVLPLCRREGLETEFAQVTSHLGSVHLTRGEYVRAAECYEEALAICRSLDNRRLTGNSLNNIGISLLPQGKYEQAEVVLDEALQLAAEIGDRGLQTIVLANLGSLKIELERYDDALEALQRADELTRGRYFINNPDTHVTLAEVLLGLERIDEAQQSADEALRIAQFQDYRHGLGCSWRIQGRIAAYREYRKSVEGTSATTHPAWTPEECFAKSAELLAETGEKAELGWTLREWAKYQFCTEGLAASMPTWKAARTLFEQLGIAFEVQRMDDLLSEWSQMSES